MKYEIYLDEKNYQMADTILQDEGLNMSIAINMFLKRVIKENSIGFIFSKANQSFNEDLTLTAPNDINTKIIKNHSYNSDIITMTKNIAKRLFNEKGYNIGDIYTFASENERSHVFWANPSYLVLNKNWFLILNDKSKRILSLFEIPAGEIKRYELVMRSDNQNLIDLQIAYNDPTFTDNRSHISFKPYFVDKITY